MKKATLFINGAFGRWAAEAEAEAEAGVCSSMKGRLRTADPYPVLVSVVVAQ